MYSLYLVILLNISFFIVQCLRTRLPEQGYLGLALCKYTLLLLLLYYAGTTLSQNLG